MYLFDRHSAYKKNTCYNCYFTNLQVENTHFYIVQFSIISFQIITGRKYTFYIVQFSIIIIIQIITGRKYAFYIVQFSIIII